MYKKLAPDEFVKKIAQTVARPIFRKNVKIDYVSFTAKQSSTKIWDTSVHSFQVPKVNNHPWAKIRPLWSPRLPFATAICCKAALQSG
jgi:hypothetical protein